MQQEPTIPLSFVKDKMYYWGDTWQENILGWWQHKIFERILTWKMESEVNWVMAVTRYQRKKFLYKLKCAFDYNKYVSLETS